METAFDKIKVSLGVGVALTAISYMVAAMAGWITSADPLEGFAVLTSYACTYLCVTQSRWNYPLGALSTIAYCFLFWKLGLYASMALNAYLPFALIYGWVRWGTDTKPRPVARLTVKEWWLYVVLTGASYALVVAIVTSLGATLPWTDALILVLSILAQWLMDNKKLENWAVWVAVNVIAIIVYFQTGVYIVALQYVFFLGNTVWGWMAWRKTMRAEAAHG